MKVSFRFHDGTFSFATAVFSNGDRVVFRVRDDTTKEQRAAEKGILFLEYLREATGEEIVEWLQGHPQYAQGLPLEGGG